MFIPSCGEMSAIFAIELASEPVPRGDNAASVRRAEESAFGFCAH
jgi:hypothetical protein